MSEGKKITDGKEWAVRNIAAQIAYNAYIETNPKWMHPESQQSFIKGYMQALQDTRIAPLIPLPTETDTEVWEDPYTNPSPNPLNTGSK